MENLENEVIEENEEQIENTEEQQIEAQADYYDRYYENVLSNMTSIKINQETIIKNQERIIDQNKTSNLFSGATVFMICLFFIYYVLRKMIIVK